MSYSPGLAYGPVLVVLLADSTPSDFCAFANRLGCACVCVSLSLSDCVCVLSMYMEDLWQKHDKCQVNILFFLAIFLNSQSKDHCF